jgi:hypothetical protein
MAQRLRYSAVHRTHRRLRNENENNFIKKLDNLFKFFVAQLVFYAFCSRHLQDAVALDNIFIGTPSVNRPNTTNLLMNSSTTYDPRTAQFTTAPPWTLVTTQQPGEMFVHLKGEPPSGETASSIHATHLITCTQLDFISFRLFIGVECNKRCFHFTQLPK